VRRPADAVIGFTIPPPLLARRVRRFE